MHKETSNTSSRYYIRITCPRCCEDKWLAKVYMAMMGLQD